MDRISTDDRRRKRPSGQHSRTGKTGTRSAHYVDDVQRKKKRRPASTDTSRKSAARKSNGNQIKTVTTNLFGGIKNIFKNIISVFSNKRLGLDKPLIIIVILLLVIGLIMMYSASYAYAYYEMGNSSYYIQRQFVFAVLGFIGMLIVSTIPPEKYKGKFIWIFSGLSYALLWLVLLTPRVNGVRRWIPLGFITFQPSELAKAAVILACAYYITKYYKKINFTHYNNVEAKLHITSNKFRKCRYNLVHSFVYGVVPFAVILILVAAPLLMEPHLSCTILVALIIATMMYAGGTKKGYFLVLAVFAAFALYLVICTDIVPYGRNRIDVWLDPFTDKLGAGWQNIQSLYAISSGGLFGVGLGNSRQKYLYISEPQNDFIFAVVCEELGLVGATFIILLFVAFIWRGFAMSVSNPDRFSKFLGIGITAQIGFQALLNVCVVTKIVPNTGISLPFFSSGGTSLLVLLAEVGVLLAISRKSPNKII